MKRTPRGGAAVGEPPTNCPHCRADLRGESIPEQVQPLYGGITHYDRTVAVEIPPVHDGVLFYRCPDCYRPFHRWPEGHPLHERADLFMERPEPPAITTSATRSTAPRCKCSHIRSAHTRGRGDCWSLACGCPAFRLKEAS